MRDSGKSVGEPEDKEGKGDWGTLIKETFEWMCSFVDAVPMDFKWTQGPSSCMWFSRLIFHSTSKGVCWDFCVSLTQSENQGVPVLI